MYSYFLHANPLGSSGLPPPPIAILHLVLPPYIRIHDFVHDLTGLIHNEPPTFTMQVT